MKSRETPWESMKREFREEVRLPLPRLEEVYNERSKKNEVPRIDYGTPPHTRMYCSYVKEFPQQLSPFDYEHSVANREVDSTEWIDIRLIRNSDFPWKAEFMKRSWNFLDSLLIQNVFQHELNIR